MSFISLTSEIRKARVEHKCVWCGEQILKGEKYFYNTGLFDGDWQSNHWHEECIEAAREELRGNYDEEFCPYTRSRPKDGEVA